MLSSRDFDHFLKYGFIKNLPPRSPMTILLDRFGNNNWYTKEIENNGLIYGIIKVGFIEFHIYNEKINGISYRPDLPFLKGEFKGSTIPWILKHNKIPAIKERLERRKIQYKHYRIKGPYSIFKTAGATFSCSDPREQTFIDTEGGVTFIFETGRQSNRQEAIQICRYYDIHLADNA